MILLTGATGYLGSRIAQELARREIPFRVLVRDPTRLRLGNASSKHCAPSPGLQPPSPLGRGLGVRGESGTSGFETVVGDLLDAEALEKALRGVERVIHTAALVKVWARARREFARVNVEGLKALLHAAYEAGVKRVVYTSSFIALGPSADANAGEGLRHPGPFSNEYEETKAGALEWLRAEGFGKFPVIALLPGVIYGPGPRTEGNLVGGMIDQYLEGNFPGLLGSGEQCWSFAFNADVVAAHLAALEGGRLGEEYVLGGDNRSLNEFFQLLGELSGVQRRVRHLPFLAGKMVGALDLARAELFGRPPQLTPGVVEIFRHDWVYSSAKAAKELGYRVTPLDEGVRKTLQNLKGEG